jgi:hypothetical protein
MAKRLAVPSKELQLQIIGPLDVFIASRVQRLSLNTDIPSTTVDEIGNPQHAGDVKDTSNVTLTFSAFDVGVKIFSALTGTDAAAYPPTGVDIAELGEIDAVLAVKDAEIADYVKSGHGKRLQIRDFTYTYNVDGESTEDYTAIGSERRWFKYDVYVQKETTGTNTWTLDETPLQLKNGNYCLSVILDGEYLEEVAAAPESGQYSYNAGDITTGDNLVSQIIIVFHSDPVGNNWTDVSDDTMPAAIRGKDVNVQILANDIPRVQNVTINGNLNPQAVKEMGNRNVVGYQRQVPTVEGSLTVLDTDTELISLLTTGTLSGDTEWEPGTGCVSVDVALKIQLYDPCDTEAPYTILKTVYVPTITIVGDAYTSNVNNNATQTFNWKSLDGSCLVYSGDIT